MVFTSKFFHESEFTCRSGEPYPLAWLDRPTGPVLAARHHPRPLGRPAARRELATARSAHNAAVGGAQASQHMEGRAADIAPMVSAEMMGACVADLHGGRVMRALGTGGLPLVGGVGYYPARWMHIDVRPKPP